MTSKPHQEPDAWVSIELYDELLHERDQLARHLRDAPLGGDGSHWADCWRSHIDCAGARIQRLEEQLETLRNCVEEYADLDNWEAVRSSETTSAWQKRWGHPTPWVDAQEALERVPYPASSPTTIPERAAQFIVEAHEGPSDYWEAVSDSTPAKERQ